MSTAFVSLTVPFLYYLIVGLLFRLLVLKFNRNLLINFRNSKMSFRSVESFSDLIVVIKNNMRLLLATFVFILANLIYTLTIITLKDKFNIAFDESKFPIFLGLVIIFLFYINYNFISKES